MKICVNCERCCEGDGEWVCDSEVSITPDLVRGGVYYKTCEEMRDNPILCGRIGVLFVEKENLEGAE